MASIYFAGLAVLVVVGYLFGRSRAAAAAARDGPLHSRPGYHGAFVVISVLVPMLLMFADRGAAGRPARASRRHSSALDPADTSPTSSGAAPLCATFSRGRRRPLSGDVSSGAAKRAAETYARCTHLDHCADPRRRTGSSGCSALPSACAPCRRSSAPATMSSASVKIVLLACATVAVLTTIGIVFSVLFETVRFFEKVSPLDFLFGRTGARRPRSAPTRSARPAPSASCRWSPAPC